MVLSTYHGGEGGVGYSSGPASSGYVLCHPTVHGRVLDSSHTCGDGVDVPNSPVVLFGATDVVE